VGCLVLAVCPAGAVEPSRAFVDGLRERGLHDMAMAYLARMSTSRLCPPDFRSEIDYEAAVTLMRGSRTVRVMSVRERNLDDARRLLEQFLAEHPDHALASSATSQLANVLVERGRMQAELAARPSKLPGEKKRLLGQARKLYTEAQEVFARAEKVFVDRLKEMPTGLIDPRKTKLIDERDQARRDLLDARLCLASVAYEIALTHEPDSKERTAGLTGAAKKYESLYEKYGLQLLAGLYARMWEGRCYKELGEWKRALAIFDELLTQSDEPESRRLKRKALILILETRLQPRVKQYRQAIETAREWEKTARGSESSSIDGLTIKYLLANAYLERARTLEKDNPDRGKYLVAARQALGFVARFPGEYHRKARAKLVDPLLAKKGAAEVEPASFDEACDRGRAALERMQTADVQDKLDRAEGKTKNHKKYVRQITEARDEAVRYYRMAQSMVTPETPVDEVNEVRYYLAFLYWARGDLYEAAVLGEFLARRYPDTAAARQGAKIALAAYARLSSEARPGGSDMFADGSDTFAGGRMVAVADYITHRWPDGPEAAEAWMMLIRAAVDRGKLDEALGYLKKLPPESSRHAEAELRIGRAFWSAYVVALRVEEADRVGQDELDKMIALAQETLEQGIRRMRKSVDEGGEITTLLFGSVLTLAQIYVGAGQPEAAIRWLDDPKIGAVTLVEAGHPAADRPGFAVKTYKTALRAYVAAQQLDKAERAMDIRKQRKTEQLKNVSRGFELFLDRISRRKQGNTFHSLSWVAETFLGMGAGFDPGGKTLPPEAREYYEKAADTFNRILEKCSADAKFAPQPGATIGVEVRLARCLRRLGQFEDAMDLLVDVLKDRNLMVDAQVEAAHTYQDWAATQGNARKYLYAIMGGRRAKRKDGSEINIVWGWGKTAKMVSRSPRHAGVFHEARYNLALCRFEYAMTLKGAEKTKTLEMARRDITVLRRLYPDLGGPEWRAKYDALLDKIQKVLGEEPVGLKTTN
jgi:tetratricopeptide (TPR) repeat protein